ncbi:MAG: amidohydrolase family protein [Armatimonadota bacterium]
MDQPGVERALIEAMSTFDVIDCHEHLVPERERLAMDVDVFTLLRGYSMYTFNLAGLSTEDAFTTIYDSAVPLDQRWALAKPYWERIRHTSYARAALLSLRHFYGYDDINDETYQPISEAIKQANAPGLYRRVLEDACHIRTALTIPIGPVTLPAPEPYFRYILFIPFYFGRGLNWEALRHPDIAPGTTIDTLDEYLAALDDFLSISKVGGMVGIKIASLPTGDEVSHAAAAHLFESLRDTDTTLPPANPLRDVIIDHAIARAVELDLVVAVHTGYWNDFRQIDPLHLIPLLQRHPAARFDVFHLGYPWVRETLMLAKGFPNVWLNLCWTHVMSQRMATDALDEALDLLPTNKILGFGADYWKPVEKVYGHLVMAREDIARALAPRVVDGRMTEAQALDIAHQWLWDNPVALYRLVV